VRVRLLNDDTGGLLDPYQSRRQMAEDYFRRGAGYIYIDKFMGRPSRLLYVDADNVGHMTNADPIFLDGILQVGGKSYESFEFLKICRRTKDGLTGKSIIDDNNDLLASAYYLIRYGLKNSKNGGKRRGVLQSENKLGDPELKKLRAAWEDMYSSDGDKALILNNGVKFSEISQTAVEQQLAEQKKEINNEICALFGLNTDVISSKASDDERIAAIKTAIMPILTAFTKSANKELLLESEKYAPEGDMYFEFDLSESMKADMLKRFQAYEIALRSKWLQPDEVRYKEDLDPLGLDFITLGLDDVLYDPKTKTVYTPNTNQTTKLGEGGVKIDEERFNPNHGADGKFISGGGAMHAPDLGGGIGGGDSGENFTKSDLTSSPDSDKIEQEKNRKELKQALADGKYITKLNKDAQKKHKLGSAEYNKELAKGNLPSYTEMSNMEIQRIINEKSLTGLVRKGTDGQFREIITLENDFGMFGDRRTGKYIKTNRGTIHYSKNGTHLVPAPPR
jgi:HK97 family phage portal protein